MSREHADQLQDMLERGRSQWPLVQEAPILAQLHEWSAFSRSNAVVLQRLCRWQAGQHQHLPYVIDPLAERIKDAFADLIFGAETEFEAPEDAASDQALLDDLVEENNLPSELQDAASMCVAEGEVWWRVYVDRDAFEHPVIEWHSRADVVPLYRGKKLLAAAFISDIDNLAPDAPVVRIGDDADPAGQLAWRQQPGLAEDRGTVWRYVEIQTGGLVRNLLYRGSGNSLGDTVALASRPEFADLPDEWDHGLEVQTRAGRAVPLMLAGRVANGKAGRLGRSQFAGVKGLLYELNKLSSVGSRNVDLTMQKRAVLGASVVQPSMEPTSENPNPPRSATAALPDAFLAPSQADDMGEVRPMGVLEFSDAWADALLAWDGGLTDKILTRCRVAPQLVGRHTEMAATGPALRARLLDSVLAADGKARAWDDELPKLIRATQMVDALPEERGGCGHAWTRAEELPVVLRSSVLPEDEGEEVARHAAAVGARIEARRTAIERLNPEWDEQRINHELELISQDPMAAMGPSPGQPGIPGAPPPSLGVNSQGGNGAGA
jgi:hypothetical protein